MDSDVNELISSIKVTGFVAKHNLPFGTAETYSQVWGSQPYACEKTKTLCIVKAIAPNFQEILIN